MQYAYMVEWVGYICIGSLPMTDERFIMVDHHIYISIEKNTSKIIYIVSLVDITYPRGFGKDCFRKEIFFFAKFLVKQLSAFPSTVPQRYIKHFSKIPSGISSPFSNQHLRDTSTFSKLPF